MIVTSIQPQRRVWWRHVLLSPLPELALVILLLGGFLVWVASYVPVLGLNQVLVLVAVCGGWGLSACWVGLLRLIVPSSPGMRWLGVRLASGGVWLFLALLLFGTALIALGVLDLLLRPEPLPSWVTPLLMFGGVAALFVHLREREFARIRLELVRVAEVGGPCPRRAAHPRLALLVAGPLLLASIGLIAQVVAALPAIVPAYTLAGGAVSGGLAWSPTGREIAVLSGNGSLGVWDTATQHAAFAVACAPDGRASLGWSHDGAYLAAVCAKSSLTVWDAQTGRALTVITRSRGTFVPLAVAWSPADDTLAVLLQGATTQTVELWDARTREGGASFSLAGSASGIVWSPDGRTLAVPQGAQITLIDARTGRQSRQLPASAAPANLAWSPDGSALLVGSAANSPSDAGSVALWNASSGQRLLALPTTPGEPPALAWSPDGKAFAVGSTTADGVTTVRNARTGSVVFTWRGQQGAVSALAWSPDGRSIASGTHDGVTAVWHPSVG